METASGEICLSQCEKRWKDVCSRDAAHGVDDSAILEMVSDFMKHCTTKPHDLLTLLETL